MQSAPMIEISEIETRLKKAQIKAEKARVMLESASTEVTRLETALSVIRELTGSIAPALQSFSGLTERQQFVVNALKFNQNNAMSPVEVYQVARRNSEFEGDINYVRTTLWRMADKQQIGNSNGAYWRFAEDGDVASSESSASSKMTEKGKDPPESDINEYVSTSSNDWGESPAAANSSYWDDDAEIPF